MTNFWRDWLTHGAELPIASGAGSLSFQASSQLTRASNWGRAREEILEAAKVKIHIDNALICNS